MVFDRRRWIKWIRPRSLQVRSTFPRPAYTSFRLTTNLYWAVFVRRFDSFAAIRAARSVWHTITYNVPMSILTKSVARLCPPLHFQQNVNKSQCTSVSSRSSIFYTGQADTLSLSKSIEFSTDFLRLCFLLSKSWATKHSSLCNFYTSALIGQKYDYTRWPLGISQQGEMVTIRAINDMWDPVVLSLNNATTRWPKEICASRSPFRRFVPALLTDLCFP